MQILNPPYSFFDPLAVRGDGENPLSLYRFRKLNGNRHLIDEIVELHRHKNIFLTPLADFRDFNEGRPNVDWGSSGIRREEVREVLIHAASAIVHSKEFADTGDNNTLANLEGSSNSGTLLADILSRYWPKEIYRRISMGDQAALESALEYLRRNTRAACFREGDVSDQAWSEYGDGGEGVCFEISDFYMYRFFSFKTPKPMEYVQQKPLLSAVDIAVNMLFFEIGRDWTLSDASFRRSDHPYFKAFRNFALVKGQGYEWEREVRLLDIGNSKPGYTYAPGLKIRRLIFGPNVGDGKIAQMRGDLHALQVDIDLARAVRGDKFESDIVPL